MILVVFFNFSRDYWLCSYIIQFYSKQIEVPKRIKMVKYGLLSAISRLFLNLFTPKHQISDKSLQKIWQFGDNKNVLNGQNMHKTIIFRGCQQISTKYRGSRIFVKSAITVNPHSVHTILRSIGQLLRVGLKIKCCYSTMLG